MFGIAWIITFIIFLHLLIGRKILDFIRNWIRIRKFVDILPGPPCVPILGTKCILKWDIIELTFQMEYIFRKYAYKNCGIFRFWLGPVPIVVLSRPKTAKVVLDNHVLIQKPPEYKLLEEILNNGLLTSSGEKWHTRRKMLTPAFHFQILKSCLPVFNKQSKVLVEVLDGYCDRNEIFDFLPVLRRYSLDIITEAGMGVSMSSQKGENTEYYLAIKHLYELIFKNLRYPWFWLKPIWYASGLGFEFDRQMKIVTTMHDTILEKRKREFEKLENESASGINTVPQKLSFMDILLNLRKEHKLSDADIKEEVGTFMIGGHDTVSASSGFVLWLLAHHPEIQDKVYEELCSIFGDSDRDVTEDDMKNMRYLEQCIKETLRMFPTAPMFLRRITQDIDICGYTIPAGVTVLISPLSLGRDPEQWENPEVYDPDRFSQEKSAGRDPYSYIPFSAGPRNCIGQKFAAMEEKVALATILRNFKIIPMLSEEENRGVPEITLKPSKGFPVRLVRRAKDEC